MTSLQKRLNCYNHSASTKPACMLNETVAPMFINNLPESMKIHPFSLSIDDSNDTGLKKMNPITVQIFDFDCNMIVTCFLDMCTTTTGSYC